MSAPVRQSPRRTALRMGRGILHQLRAFHLANGKSTEALSYLFARRARALGRDLILIPDTTPLFRLGPDCYQRQVGGNVRLHKDVLNGLLVEFARTDYDVLVNVHDHWFTDDANFSAIDDTDDLDFDQYLRKRYEPMLRDQAALGPPRRITNLSLVIARNGIAARVADSQTRHRFRAVERFSVLNDLWQIVPAVSPTPNATGSQQSSAGIHARHHGFLSPTHQATLRDLHVALVGCGGIGSIAAEALARTGVGALTLIDPDRVELSNLNRWQGGSPADVGVSKATLLARNLRRLVPTCRVHTVRRELADPIAVAAMTSADLLLGGLDNDLARHQLNHICVQYLMPYFDIGVALTAGPPADLRGRCFTVIPGVTPCTHCTPFDLINAGQVAEALADPAIQQERRAAGYVVDRPTGDGTPSAYLLNMRTVSFALIELLNFITGWRPLSTNSVESWQTGALERADGDNFARAPAPGCPLCTLRLGGGALWAIPAPHRGSLVAAELDHHGREQPDETAREP